MILYIIEFQLLALLPALFVRLPPLSDRNVPETRETLGRTSDPLDCSSIRK
jgi:hypothetical protein